MKATDLKSPDNPKRMAILKAATEEFHAAGFSGTSMDRIAEVAKVSKRTVYNHFPSKDDLFRAILDELQRKVGEMRTVEYTRAESLDHQLETIGSIFAETITARDFIKLSRVVVSHFISQSKWGKSTYEQQTIPRKNLIEWISSAKDDGRLSVRDTASAAAQYSGMIKELVYWPELMWGQAPASPGQRKVAVESATAIFLDHFGLSRR